jgi:hypothetical protein
MRTNHLKTEVELPFETSCTSYMPQKMTAFWDIASCRHTEFGRSFKDAYCLHHQGDDNLKALITSETSVRFYETTGALYQEVLIFILAAMKTLNLTNIPQTMDTVKYNYDTNHVKCISLLYV